MDRTRAREALVGPRRLHRADRRDGRARGRDVAGLHALARRRRVLQHVDLSPCGPVGAPRVRHGLRRRERQRGPPGRTRAAAGHPARGAPRRHVRAGRAGPDRADRYRARLHLAADRRDLQAWPRAVPRQDGRRTVRKRRPVRRVLVTGSAGVIGTVLTTHLPYDITGLDLPDGDIADYPRLVEHCRGQDAVIHLAGEFTTENWRSGDINPANFRLDLNVLDAAVEARVRRIVLASSVHADDFFAHDGPGLITADRALPVPTSPYGAHKLFLE